MERLKVEARTSPKRWNERAHKKGGKKSEKCMENASERGCWGIQSNDPTFFIPYWALYTSLHSSPWNANNAHFCSLLPDKQFVLNLFPLLGWQSQLIIVEEFLCWRFLGRQSDYLDHNNIQSNSSKMIAQTFPRKILNHNQLQTCYIEFPESIGLFAWFSCYTNTVSVMSIIAFSASWRQRRSRSIQFLSMATLRPSPS